MPVTTAEDELTFLHLLHDGDDSSDEDESSEDESDSGTGNASEDSDNEDSESDDESGSGSDDDDSDDDDDDDDSGSGSDSDASSSSKKKKKKKKGKGAEEEKKDAEDTGPSAIFRIQQISSKLSYLLDDLHKTFKPKSVPKIDPSTVFPYPYAVILQTSPKRGYYRSPLVSEIGREHHEHEEPLTQIHSAHPKSPISSPLRHGNSVDRGAGGNFIFPSYAAPPTQSEIKNLYKNYSDGERVKIARNQKRRDQKEKAPLWRSGDFSKEFISASNSKARQRRETTEPAMDGDGDGETALDEMAPHTFDELYQHYDQQKRLIEQKQNKMQRMRNKLNWFKKNSAEKRVRVRLSGKALSVAEQQPLKKDRESKQKQLFASQSVKDRESNLLNKAAQILMGSAARGRSRTPPENEYDGVAACASPDSLQEKILCIASDEEAEEEEEEDVNRMPTFV